MRALQEKETDLHGQIKMLEKEVSAHKKEVKSRDAAIGEKEKVGVHGCHYCLPIAAVKLSSLHPILTHPSFPSPSLPL